MADQTDPLASGTATLEGKAGIAGIAAGIILAILGGVVPVFQQAADANPNVPWLHLATLLAGATMTIISTVVLTKSRTLVKGSALDLMGQAGALIAPMVAGALLKKYLTPQQATTLASGGIQATTTATLADGKPVNVSSALSSATPRTTPIDNPQARPPARP